MEAEVPLVEVRRVEAGMEATGGMVEDSRVEVELIITPAAMRSEIGRMYWVAWAGAGVGDGTGPGAGADGEALNVRTITNRKTNGPLQNWTIHIKFY